MMMKIELATQNNFGWTLSCGDATFESEHVPPEDRVIDHFNYQDGLDIGTYNIHLKTQC